MSKPNVNFGRVVLSSVGCVVLLGVIFAGIVLAAQARVRQPVQQVVVTTAYPDFTLTATRVPVGDLLKTQGARVTDSQSPSATATRGEEEASATVRPTALPLVVSSPTAAVRPGNCATALAMGLSDVEAGRWSHLDRDKDGVACHGD